MVRRFFLAPAGRIVVAALGMLALVLSLVLAPNAGAATTLRVLGFAGVSANQRVAGTLNIEAVVEGDNITQVVFNLSGAATDTHKEGLKPYYFKGDNNGTPRGWNTTTVPDGTYTLKAEASTTDGQKSSASVTFIVSNRSGPTPVPTALPSPTPVPSTGNTGACGESNSAWHPPVINGCAAGHEHGDAPPSWISAAGYRVSFNGGFNTSAQENKEKHVAMKGFTTRFSNTDLYFRIHAASNPLDRSARFHSYEVWARDTKGNVSHWQGWYDSGDPVKDRIPRRRGEEILRRPIMLVVDQTAYDQGIKCEQWYGLTALWGWDFGWMICGTTTIYKSGENATAYDQSTWKIAPDNNKGVLRRLEAAWYSERKHPTGTFYATQFGDIVSGPTDPRCSATTTKYGVTYQNVCLEQYIAPTMTDVKFPGNAEQKQFDGTGVKFPN